MKGILEAQGMEVYGQVDRAAAPAMLMPVEELLTVDREQAGGGVPLGPIDQIGLSASGKQDILQWNSPELIGPVMALIRIHR